MKDDWSERAFATSEAINGSIDKIRWYMEDHVQEVQEPNAT